jgi:hypothetical protein
MAADLALLLEVAGHDVLVTRDIGGARWTDDTLLLSAVRNGRIFLTHNRGDFRMLHDAWVTWPAAFGLAFPPHPGVLVLDAASPETLARIVVSFLDGTPTDRLTNGIFWWRRHAGWQQASTGAAWEPYQPPVGSEQE